METDYGETYTVSELIAELQKLPPDLPVITEGCDCNGPAGSVWLQYGTAYIRRETADRITAREAEHAEILRQIEEAEARLRAKYPGLQ